MNATTQKSEARLIIPKIKETSAMSIIKKRFSKTTIAAAVIVGLSAIHSCSEKKTSYNDAPAAAVEAPTTNEQVLAKIQDGAIEVMTAEDYPKMFKKLGKAGAEEAKQGAYAAAYRVAKGSECKSVQTASVTMESTKKKMAFFANCETQTGDDLPATGWHFKAADLKDESGNWYTAENAPAAGMSDNRKEKDRRAAADAAAPGDWQQCEDALKDRLPHPSSMDSHYLTGKAETVDGKGRRIIYLDFDAQNQYGNVVGFTGKCQFSKDGQHVTTWIDNR